MGPLPAAHPSMRNPVRAGAVWGGQTKSHRADAHAGNHARRKALEVPRRMNYPERCAGSRASNISSRRRAPRPDPRLRARGLRASGLPRDVHRRHLRTSADRSRHAVPVLHGQARGPRCPDRAHRGPHHRGRPALAPVRVAPWRGVDRGTQRRIRRRALSTAHGGRVCRCRYREPDPAMARGTGFAREALARIDAQVVSVIAADLRTAVELGVAWACDPTCRVMPRTRTSSDQTKLPPQSIELCSRTPSARQESQPNPPSAVVSVKLWKSDRRLTRVVDLLFHHRG